MVSDNNNDNKQRYSCDFDFEEAHSPSFGSTSENKNGVPVDITGVPLDPKIDNTQDGQTDLNKDVSFSGKGNDFTAETQTQTAAVQPQPTQTVTINSAPNTSGDS